MSKVCFVFFLLSSSVSFSDFTNLCDLRGKDVLARYTFKGRIVEKYVRVGSSDCLGACAKECYKLNLGLKVSFTQECLNHDLCHQETKNLRECHDELKLAFDGYVNAPKCSRLQK